MKRLLFIAILSFTLPALTADELNQEAAPVGVKIQIKDHINNTGTNILIGKQKTLNIDFIDLTNLYSYDQKKRHYPEVS